MKDWLAVALLFLLDLVSKPTFWICLAILGAGSIVSSAIERSTQLLNRRLETIAQRLRKEPADDDDDLLDDEL